MAATRAEERRLLRRARWEHAFSPGPLALCGAALSLSLLFLPGLSGRTLLFAVAALCAWASGRRLSPFTTLVVMAGIVAANLLVPLGRRLAQWGPLLITETALLEGLEKAITFEALVLLSKASLGPSLRLPGRLGAFFGDALRTYDRILERKNAIRAASFFTDIDAALVSVYDETADQALKAPAAGSGAKNALLWLAPGLAAAAFALSALAGF